MPDLDALLPWAAVADSGNGPQADDLHADYNRLVEIDMAAHYEADMTPRPICLTCRERFAVKRGCCSRCIMRHRGAVAEGETTWAELERRGLVLPVRAKGSAWRRPLWQITSREQK